MPSVQDLKPKPLQALAKSADVRLPVRNAAAAKRSDDGRGGAARSGGGAEQHGAEGGPGGDDSAAAAAAAAAAVSAGFGDFDEGAVDVIEANNKPSRKSLWTRWRRGAMEWRRGATSHAHAALPRVACVENPRACQRCREKSLECGMENIRSRLGAWQARAEPPRCAAYASGLAPRAQKVIAHACGRGRSFNV